MSNCQVLFNGITVEGRNVEGVEKALAGELGIDHSKARRLFNGRTVVLASQLAREEALSLQRRLEAIGAVTRIKDLAPKTELPPDYERDRAGADSTLRDLTAAHVDCPRCGHMQLESSHCARCGVDIEALFRKRRKEELLMDKQLRDHRAAKEKQAQQLAQQASEEALAAAGPIAADPSDHPGAKGGFFSRLFKRSA